MRILAPAKINLYLKINQLQSNGFHDLVSLFYQVNFHDILDIKKSDKFHLETTGFTVPKQKNILRKVLQLVKKVSRNKDINVEVKLKKNIPPGSGLGGGSSDAVALLKYLDKQYKLQLTTDEIMDILNNLGSDVAFFLKGGAAIGLERGNKIIPIINNFNYPILLVYPEIALKTETMYQALDQYRTNNKLVLEDYNYKNDDRLTNLIAGLKENNLDMVCSNLHNDFQPLAEEEYPPIKQALQLLKDSGAQGTLLTGSGSTVFGIYPSETLAKKSLPLIKKSYKLTYLL